jgi:hypothetical protein
MGCLTTEDLQGRCIGAYNTIHAQRLLQSVLYNDKEVRQSETSLFSGTEMIGMMICW